MAFADDLKRFGPDKADVLSLSEARAYCARLAATHYENFSVVTWLTPRPLRPAFRSIYAFCRWSDDLGDEVGDPARARELLGWWRGELGAMYAGEVRHPVMIALAETVAEFAIPIAPFEALISAFEQDQVVSDYATYAQLLDYCSRSANPVGHLVLYLGRSYDEENARLSDLTCTGLQLANFWQDVARDRAIGRILHPCRARIARAVRRIPKDDLRACGFHPGNRGLARASQVGQGPCGSAACGPGVGSADASRPGDRRRPLRAWGPCDPRPDRGAGVRRPDAASPADEGDQAWTDRARSLISQARGGHLPPQTPDPGLPPTRGEGEKAGKNSGPPAPHRGGERRVEGAMIQSSLSRRGLSPSLHASYQFCGVLARHEARNFYYSFLLLPPHLRRSMCALYAFMRRTDDLADDPAPGRDGDADLEKWRCDVHRALDGGDDRGWPGLAAVAATVERHAIPRRYLDAVIDGVAMDLHPRPFATFDELYDYCYRVASVVGMCCLHIWGYRSDGGRAESLAEACGIALQLTNIVRDVREDAEHGRLYLPQEDLGRFGVAPEELTAHRTSERVRALLAYESHRAYAYYDQARPLAEFVAPVGRPVLATIVGIYRTLLDEITRRDYDVLAERVSLPAWRKVSITLRSVSGRFHVPRAFSGEVPRC